MKFNEIDARLRVFETAHDHWLLRKQGRTVGEATSQVKGSSTTAKHDLLFGAGINYNILPAWQKRGVGFYWEDYVKSGLNPVSQQPIETSRRRLATNMELPLSEAYAQWVGTLLSAVE
ncbi:hypothetical protein [Hymenobacter volaticus]|uniref:Thg1 C-terminal domain-containing protein n=1 Tax=Hymenobacter volaticus TaxID=2932254 RepID=A0ABY4GCV1_9BACT|nr:hypothetical protein [Hymenobacter volaticus]UOQ68389.1 hypothetical protein MUN86_11380 [Hymenobacter volaticus]